MITNIIIFVAGFIVGALVARKNLDEVNKVVEEAKELAAKAEAELKELKAKKKSPVKRGRKPAVKK
jgi:F0F1-type ATP synthase membrane subunit b/b'